MLFSQSLQEFATFVTSVQGVKDTQGEPLRAAAEDALTLSNERHPSCDDLCFNQINSLTSLRALLSQTLKKKSQTVPKFSGVAD